MCLLVAAGHSIFLPTIEQKPSLTFCVFDSLLLRFPARHFGKLYGLVMSLSAVISLLQYPCFSLVKGPLDGDPFYVSTRYQFTKDERIFVFNALYCMMLQMFEYTPSVSGGYYSHSPLCSGVHPSRLRLHPLQEKSPEQGEHPSS